MDVADTNASTGFALSRVLPGTPAEVFDHFTNPALFSRWFIVEGFATPASRVNLDPRPGGAISAVMVPDEDGPEIPFTAAYGIVEPQRRIQFTFTDPTETWTICAVDAGCISLVSRYRYRGQRRDRIDWLEPRATARGTAPHANQGHRH